MNLANDVARPVATRISL